MSVSYILIIRVDVFKNINIVINIATIINIIMYVQCHEHGIEIPDWLN